MSKVGFPRWSLPIGAAILLLAVAPCIAGCNSTTQYQRPRNEDMPRIYADSPVPMGRLKD
jgi:hypothetical protein